MESSVDFLSLSHLMVRHTGEGHTSFLCNPSFTTRNRVVRNEQLTWR